VLVDKRAHVLATGYNGGVPGAPHCIDVPCAGANLPSGQGLDLCEAIHAEQNALLQCYDVHTIATAYVTTAPCVTCTKLLLNTSCEMIVFRDSYAEEHMAPAKELWRRAGRVWVQAE